MYEMNVYAEREKRVRFLHQQFENWRRAAEQAKKPPSYEEVTPERYEELLDEARQAGALMEDTAKDFLAEFFALWHDFGHLTKAEEFARGLKVEVHDALWALDMGIEE